MDEENQNERISADPKIRELTEKIKQAELRQEIARATASFSNNKDELLETSLGGPEKSTEKDALTALRTYERDAAEAIKNKKTSLVSIGLAESGRRDKVARVAHRVFGIAGRLLSLYVSLVLIVAGISVLAIIYYIKNHNEPPPIVRQASSIIAADSEKDLEVTGFNASQLISAIYQESQLSAPANSVVRLILQKKSGGNFVSLDSAAFMEIVAKGAPGALIRAFDPDLAVGFLKGATTTPFLILKINSFDNAFSGMLAWENTMPEDLKEFFGNKTGGSRFEDVVLKNKDARLWRDAAGNTSFLYSFVDKNTLVIIGNERAFKGVLDKLVAAKYVR